MTLESIYYNIHNPSGFGSIRRLKKASKQSYTTVEKFLNKQPLYRKFKRPKRHFKRAQFKATSMAHQFQADLFDFQKYARQNSGYKWVLLVVDIFSRYVKCEPLKNKTGEETARGLRKILTELKNEGRLAGHTKLATDLGNEFFNKHCNDVLTEFNTHHFSLLAPIKCGLAEISGRYILEKLHKYMAHNNTKRWIDALPSVVDAKNKRKSAKTANLAPSEITFSNQHLVTKTLYPEGPNHRGIFKYNIGDRVQLFKPKALFTKSYHGYLTDKTYRISSRRSLDVPRYSLIDEDDDEPIAGTWYAEELYPIE